MVLIIIFLFFYFVSRCWVRVRKAPFVHPAFVGLGWGRALLSDQTGFRIWSVGFVLGAAAKIVIHLQDRTYVNSAFTVNMFSFNIIKRPRSTVTSAETWSDESISELMQGREMESKSTFSIRLDSLFTSWVSFCRFASFVSSMGGGGPEERSSRVDTSKEERNLKKKC